MNKTFEVEFREDHVYVMLGPNYEVTTQQEVEFWAAIEEACKKFNSSRVLVEGYVPNVNLNLSMLFNQASGLRSFHGYGLRFV